jgi:hypothetical protein
LTSASPDQLFHIYLNDHRSGSVGAHLLAVRARDANRGTEFGAFLDEFVDELVDDIDQLDTVFARCSVTKNGPKLIAAAVGVTLGRFKLNGRLTDYSPLTRVLEFEALTIGVRAKRQLWTTIAGLPSGHPASSAIDTSRLIERAETQARHLEESSARASAVAFLGATVEPAADVGH